MIPCHCRRRRQVVLVCLFLLVLLNAAVALRRFQKLPHRSFSTHQSSAVRNTLRLFAASEGNDDAIEENGESTASAVVSATSLIENSSNDNIEVPTKGLIDYIGSTVPADPTVDRWGTAPPLQYTPPTKAQLGSTRFRLWRQWPWKKIKGKAVITLKIGGALPLEAPPSGGLPFAGPKDLEPVSSLNELMRLFLLGTYDPRIEGVYITLSPVSCGYGKLQELRRAMKLFRDAGKRIIGFAETASEKDLYLAMGFDEFYIPPEGILDLRGFSASAQFVRGVFDKIGIEPQVQRIGKYKSFGDTFNRTEISEAQREVISSLLTEASDFWVDAIAMDTNLTVKEIRCIWNETKVTDPLDFEKKGLLTGVKYKDQVDEYVADMFTKPKPLNFFAKLFSSSKNATEELLNKNKNEISRQEDLSSFDMERDFIKYPRRQYGLNATEQALRRNTTDPSNKELLKREKVEELSRKRRTITASAVPGMLYLRKMRKGDRILTALPIQERRAGPRIAIINAVGGIASGESNGNNIGSDTLIKLVRQARYDPNVKAVVMRIDSPGGSALASDVMWKEIRALSRKKPVVASQVDVAASGGYYLSMACDEIVSEELTVTGSIGVVTSKFNAEELNKKIGLGTETISIGRYAEFFRTDRGFTDEEAAYFEANAQKFYKSFITKAAMSRNMSVDDMHEVAQGRVWTGRQALQRGLADHMGGLWRALEIATNMTEEGTILQPSRKGPQPLPVQTLQPPRKPPSIPFVSALSGRSGNNIIPLNNDISAKARDPLAVIDDVIIGTNLVSPESLGVNPILHKMGLGSPILSSTLRSSGILTTLENMIDEIFLE